MELFFFFLGCLNVGWLELQGSGGAVFLCFACSNGVNIINKSFGSSSVLKNAAASDWVGLCFVLNFSPMLLPTTTCISLSV